MAKKKETGELEIRLTTEQANQRIKELTQNAKLFEKQLDDVGKGNPAARRKIVQDLQATEAEILKIRESLKTDQRLIINGEVAGKSVREVNAAVKSLQRELNAIGDDTDPEFIKKARQVAVLKQRLEQLRKPVKDFKADLQNVGEEDSFTSLKAKASRLGQELELLAPSTKKFISTATELGQVERRMEFITQATKLAKGEIDKIGEPGSLARLRHEADDLRKQLEKLSPASRDFAATYIQLDKVEQEIKAIKQETIGLEKEFIEIGNVGSFTHLSAKAKALRDELNRLSPSTQEFLAKTRELQQVERQMGSLNRTIEGTTGFWKGLSAQVKQFGVLAASYLGFQAIVGQAQNIIRHNAELSDSLADVRQTTGLTEIEVQKLSRSLKQIDTRTATKELLDIAKVAGQFGVPTDQILSFTKAINKSTVVLKSEFKGGAEEITTTLTKMRNVLNDIKTDNIADDLLKLGNAEIVLAQTGASTAPVISDFTNRIGGMAGPLGLATDKILGISATLEETGVTAERGGTAIGRIFQKMITNSQEFAKVAGVPLKEFQHLIDTDIYGAFIKFVEGSTKGGTSATAFNKILTDTELSGNGAREVLAKIAGNLPLLTSRVQTAGEALKSTSTITEQYNIKNNNFAANLERLGKNMYSFFTNSSMTKAFDGIIKGLNGIFERTPKFQQLIDGWKDLNAQTQEQEKSIYPLLANYANLSSKTHLNADQQKELKDIIEKVAKVIPSAVTEFDKYGNALGINTEKAKEFLEAQQKLTQFKNKEALEQANIQLKSYESSIIGIQGRLNKLLKDPFEEIYSAAGVFQGVKKVTDQELQGLRDSLKDLNEQAAVLNLQIRELKGLPLVDETQKKTTTTETKEVKETTVTDPEALKKLDEFRQKMEQLNIDIANKRIELLKSQEEAELNALNHKYEEERLATGNNLQQLTLLEEKYQQDKANIKAAYENKYDLATLENRYKSERAAVKKAIDDITNDEKISDEDKVTYRQRANKLLLEIDEKFLLDKKNLLEKFSEERKETEFQQDTKNLLDWHALQKKEITDAYNDRKITKEKYDREIENLERKNNDYKLQLAKDYGKSVLEIEQLIVEGKIKGYQDDTKAALDNEMMKLQLRLRLANEGSEEYLEIQKRQLEIQRDRDINAANGDTEAIRLIWENYYNDIEELELNHLRSQIDKFQDYASHVTNALRAVNDYQKTLEDADLARDKRIHDAKRKNLEERLAAGKISKADYNTQLYNLDKEYDNKNRALRKKQFEREQSQAKTEAIINGIVSITKTLASYKYPVNIILAALDAVAVGAEIAKIDSQPPPEFATGKPAQVRPGRGGIPAGPSHKEGGIDLVDTNTGDVIGNMEGQEPIYSTETYRRNKRVMDILMDASLHHAGKVQVPLTVGGDIRVPVEPPQGRVISNATKFGDGKLPGTLGSHGVVNIADADSVEKIIQKYTTVTSAVPHFIYQPIVHVINAQRISENIDVKRFGYTSATGIIPPSPDSVKSESNSTASISDMKKLIAANTEAINTHAKTMTLLEQRLKIPLKAEMPYYENKQRLADIEQAKRNATIG